MDRRVQGRGEPDRERPPQSDSTWQANDDGPAHRSRPAGAGERSGTGSADAGSPSDPVARINRRDARDSGDLRDPVDPLGPVDPPDSIDPLDPVDPLDLIPPHGAIARRQRLAELEREITVLARHLNAAQHRFLKLLAEFDSGRLLRHVRTIGGLS